MHRSSLHCLQRSVCGRPLSAFFGRIPASRRPFSTGVRSSTRQTQSDIEYAQPLSFLSVSLPQSPPSTSWRPLIDAFLERGWNCQEISANIAPHGDDSDLAAALDGLASHISELVRAESAFPPVLFAADNAALLAHVYVSSWPVEALVLHNEVPAQELLERLGVSSSSLPAINYEPEFPILNAPSVDFSSIHDWMQDNSI